jgi:hypothetical protein
MRAAPLGDLLDALGMAGTVASRHAASGTAVAAAAALSGRAADGTCVTARQARSFA